MPCRYDRICGFLWRLQPPLCSLPLRIRSRLEAAAVTVEAVTAGEAAFTAAVFAAVDLMAAGPPQVVFPGVGSRQVGFR